MKNKESIKKLKRDRTKGWTRKAPTSLRDLQLAKQAVARQHLKK